MRNFHFQVRGTRDHILEIMKYDVVNKIWPMTSNEEIKKKKQKRWVSAMGNEQGSLDTGKQLGFRFSLFPSLYYSIHIYKVITWQRKKNKVKAGTGLRDSSMLKSPSDLPEDPIKVL